MADHERWQTRPEWGYRLNFSPAENEIIHQFCGANTINGGTCPNCQKPLMLLLSLDASDSRLDLNASIHPFVHLLYCWTCSIPFGDFSYKLRADGGVELLQIPPKYEYEFGPSGPYEGFTGPILGASPVRKRGDAALDEGQPSENRRYLSVKFMRVCREQL